MYPQREPAHGARDGRERDSGVVEDHRVSAGELLLAWREAPRAAELTARLAAEAAAAVEEADSDAVANNTSSNWRRWPRGRPNRPATDARRCAERARARADAYRTERLPQADQAWEDAKTREAEARLRYEQSSNAAPHADLTSF